MSNILLETDELFWPEITDQSSLYFHKLAVKSHGFQFLDQKQAGP